MTKNQVLKHFKNNADYIATHRLNDKVLESIPGAYPLFGTDEVFVELPTHKDYFISSYGRLISFKHERYRLLVPNFVNGYYIYSLSQPHKRYKGEIVKAQRDKRNDTPFTAQALVASIFCPNFFADSKVEIHHLDKNRRNNYYLNLIALTPKVHYFFDHVRKIKLYDGKKTRTVSLYEAIEITGLSPSDLVPKKENLISENGSRKTYCIENVIITYFFYKK